MKVIIINGAARTGKDTFVEMVADETSTEVINLSTIDPVKNAMKRLGWDGVTKNDETRLMMADLKQLWIRHMNGPFNYIVKTINDIMLVQNGVDVNFFVHCREPEEIAKLKQYYKYDGISLLIKRDGLHVPKNGADDIVENYVYDHMVDNSGSLELLRFYVREFIKTWGLSTIQLHDNYNKPLKFDGKLKLDF